MARHKLRQTMERKILSVRRHWGRGTQSDRGNHTNGNSVDNLLHATRRGNNVGNGNSSRQCGKPPAKVATTTRSMMLPLLLLLLDCCCWFLLLLLVAPVCACTSALCGKVHHRGSLSLCKLVWVYCQWLQPSRRCPTNSCSELSPHHSSPVPSSPLCLVEAIKLHFEAAQKFA